MSVDTYNRPPRTCHQPVRGGGICKLNGGHGGHHTPNVYICDGCNKPRRGQPHAYARDGEYERGMAFCFLCAVVNAG